ncbi:MAG: hypothetical protein FWG97_04815, partial [Deltaproteobacteria bacterium]|nr:hypothetical protein [Deltaproteobacteria bacterium]
MKRIASCALVLALGLFFVHLAPAFAGQHIVIDTNVGNTSVYGNSPDPDGTAPPDEPTATGNSVTVNNGGTVGLTVYGGYARSDTGNATATGNSVTVNSGGMVVWDVRGGYAIG